MNLTTPPPVEPLDPEFSTDLRHHLVRRVRKKHHLPFWIPVLAAACGIAIVVACGILIARPGGHAGPAGQPTAELTDQSLDLGAATSTQAQASARSCLASLSIGHRTDPIPAKSLDPKTIKLRSAHWIKALGLPGQTRQLVQTFSTANGLWVFCVDGKWQSYVQAGDDQGNPSDGIYSSSLQWSGLPDASTTTLRAFFSLTSRPSVAQVEIRLRGARGTTPWSVAKIVDGAGYVAAALPSPASQHGPVQADVRALDKAGNVVYSETFNDN
ncbi:hypothetical protein [Kribbella kalugense]|uniref:Uncharacterized protein n=1 Tax=Kribbella kalugense TaxID=2512221 RepID=A0A4R7ZU01_9ACTN|nr:hypothetical protein [Kribbella kalugense]TDW21533.1 hypothetical protein EV650_0360 [Kribbella kalugense]